jgi:cytochrome c-type biogenesis protein CcmH
MGLRYISTLALLALPMATPAAIDPLTFRDPAEESRFQELIVELRCLVCQNQSLADSNAELAGDLRREVYNKMREGASNQEIIDFLVARYSDFVLYRPPVKSTTLLLWFAPFALLALGATALTLIIRRRRLAPAPMLTATEQQRIKSLLDSNKDENSR